MGGVSISTVPSSPWRLMILSNVCMYVCVYARVCTCMCVYMYVECMCE